MGTKLAPTFNADTFAVKARASSIAIAPEEDAIMSSDDDVYSKVDSSSTRDTRESTPPTPKGKKKKTKYISRAPIATDISTFIPVTGERPRPEQKDHPAFEDEVLYQIFLILWESNEGITVKEICQHLEQDVSNLSTKVSNLVSAKMNAYIKRLERGDATLKYAISRAWSSNSPKRMVYAYRGLLAPGWEAEARKLSEKEKKVEFEKEVSFETENVKDTMMATGAAQQSTVAATPAAAATAATATSAATAATAATAAAAAAALPSLTATTSFKGIENFHLCVPTTTPGFLLTRSTTRDSVENLDEEDSLVTVASAARRGSRAFSLHSADAAAGGAALHASACRAASISFDAEHLKWFRSGFVDIGAPEDVNLSDLDRFF
ncbi:GDS1 [Candida oxycetoniae]|uniref:GDS1 n=1 Tax=Candida oxycetoniae TaxID=497107 RepID=A0AAI9SXF9_9ASCO|nr:GDS1 [Candida oxycetoniae]KAI3404891.2 GDS1 [Candida oxycetoniae]